MAEKKKTKSQSEKVLDKIDRLKTQAESEKVQREKTINTDDFLKEK